MRLSCLALALVALVGCGKSKSKLDAERGADVDALWDLAPDGTRFGVVASPRAVGLGFRAVDAIRELMNHPDFAPAKPQVDGVIKSIFGGPTATPADAGYATDKPFAFFETTDGNVLAVMPVGDRAKYMTGRHGEVGSGSADDTLEGNTCRMIGAQYVCVTKVEMFDRLRKGSLRGKVAAAGARGDAEAILLDIPLLGDAKGDIVLAAQLEPGQVALWGRWIGAPDGLLKNLVGLAAPKPDTSGASGFVALNISPLLTDAPPLPIAGGVTFDQIAKSLTGPLNAVIPAGSVDVQLFAPLSDPKPLQTVIDNCKDVGTFFELAKTQTPGACRIVLQGTNALELDAWVEGNQLRLGAHKGPRPAGKPGGMTAVGNELGNGSWTAAFWGRGTMLNLTGITPTQTEAPTEVQLGIHAMSLVNELGVGIRVEKDGVRLRAFGRTAWTNDANLAKQIIAVKGADIVSGKATEPAKQLAKSAPGSPFAADFDAGQGGLMVPAAMIGLGSAVVIPAVMRLFGSGGGGGEEGEMPGESPTGQPPMNQADLTSLLLHAYVEDAWPKWQAEHPKQKCPAKLAEVAKYFGDQPDLPVIKDPWGNDLVMKCDDKGFSVVSMGPDGKLDTADDVKP
jgi:hypothetical protein